MTPGGDDLGAAIRAHFDKQRETRPDADDLERDVVAYLGDYRSTVPTTEPNDPPEDAA